MGPRIRSVASACAAVALAGCGHDWEAYDPLGGGTGSGSDAATGATSGGAGGDATVSGAGAGAGTTSAAGGATTGVGGSGASGGDPPGLVAAYAFDEGSGAALTDATANGNDGQIVGATWIGGKHGGALSFDGESDHVRVPADPSWQDDAGTQYTIEAWVRVNLPGMYAGAVTVGPWTGQRAALMVHNGIWSFNMLTVGGPNDWRCDAESGSLSYLVEPDGQFHHVAGVLDLTAAECRLYLDGALVSTDTFVDGALAFGSNDLTIGGYDGSNYLAADIDDVRIYQRALGDAEIAADAETPVQP